MDGIAIIGFGEAGQAFATSWPAPPPVRAFDILTDRPEARAAKLADFERAGVTGCASAREAIAGAGGVLSLVTADQALATAQDGARHLVPGAFWFDMNSVAPDTKRTAADIIEGAGGRYVDVAVMAPVDPAKARVPLLVSGSHAGSGAELLRRIGFGNVRVVEGGVGRASSIKMVRSVMVKGIEALTAECVRAADRAGVLEEVLASLDASPPPSNWTTRADYNLDRMMAHGLRRSAEMEEVVKTLDALGTGSDMTRATVVRQHAIGVLGATPPQGLAAKLALLNASDKAQAA